VTRLSKTTVDATAPDEQGDVVVWDEDLRGFGLRVKKTGIKSYIVQYRTADGRSSRLTLGRHGVITAEQARRLAIQKMGDISKGNDPAAEKKAARAALTVAQLCDLYVTERLATRKPSSVASAKADIENHCRGR
jgi:hypothetical protein